MNTPTAVGTYIFGIVVVIAIGIITRRMLVGWKNRARRQAEQIGVLPPVPELLHPAVIAPTRGLYVGSTFASHWLDRVAVGDLGPGCRLRSRRTVGEAFDKPRSHQGMETI